MLSPVYEKHVLKRGFKIKAFGFRRTDQGGGKYDRERVAGEEGDEMAVVIKQRQER